MFLWCECCYVSTSKHHKHLLGESAVIEAFLHQCRNANLWTPIGCAAYNGQAKVVEMLIEAGAEVNPADEEEITPLHLAVQEGHLSVVEVLLKNNADTGKCENGLNSLDMAIDNNHE